MEEERHILEIKRIVCYAYALQASLKVRFTGENAATTLQIVEAFPYDLTFLARVTGKITEFKFNSVAAVFH